MQEIRLWKVSWLSGPKDSLIITDISNAKQAKTEAMLEEILVKSPALLGDDMTLWGHQIQTAGGPLDLLGIDGKGRLVVFELKKGVLTRDAVAQIIDYASCLANLPTAELNSRINANSGIDKISDDFAAWYGEEFSGESLNTKPKMVLVGLGADERARRMVEYLADSGIEISLITFHSFDDGGAVFLARQVEVAERSPPPSMWSKAVTLPILLSSTFRIFGEGPAIGWPRRCPLMR